MSPTKVTEISPPNSSTLILSNDIQQQVPTETIESNSDTQKDPNISEISASKDKFLTQLTINFNSRILKRFHFRNLLELKE